MEIEPKLAASSSESSSMPDLIDENDHEPLINYDDDNIKINFDDDDNKSM